MTRNWVFRSVLIACAGAAVSACAAAGEDSASEPAPLAPSLQAAQTFSGHVVDASGAPVVGARVTINGIVRVTGSSGQYAVSIAESSTGYRFDIRKDGFGPVTEFRLTGALSLVHQLLPAFAMTISANAASVVTEPSSGIQVQIPANALRSSTGTAQGNVQFSIIPHTSQTMPGDFTAQNAAGRRVALISVGAVTLQAVDSKNNTLGLVPGASLTITLPVPAAAGGSMPSCVLTGACRAAMWRFQPSTGLWVENSASRSFGSAATTFTLRGADQGTIDPADGLGTWNADVELTTPACMVISLPAIPNDCYNPFGATPEPGIKVSFTQALAGGGTKSKTTNVLSTAAFILLYNLRPSVNVDLQFTFPPGAPAHCGANMTVTSTPAPSPGFPMLTSTGASTQVNAGAAWGGTGYPTDTGGMPVDLGDVIAMPRTDPCHSFLEVTTF
jgi:hypothetical protein